MIDLVAKKGGAKFKIDLDYFVKGGFWLTVGQVVTIFLGLFTTVLLANYLDERDYGVYRYLLGLAGLFSVFSLTGLGSSVLQTAAQGYISFYKESIALAFKYSLLITTVAGVASGYYFFQGNQLLGLGCLLIAVLQPLINTYQYVPNFLQGSKRFKESALLHAFKTSIVSIITVITLLTTKSVLLLIATYLATNALANFLSHIFYTSKKKLSDDHRTWDKFILYAKHTSLRNILLSVAQKIDSVIVFTQLGAVELAIYSVANVIPEQLKASFKNVSTLLIPKYANNLNNQELKKSVFRRSWQMALILICITVFYILIAPLVYKVLFPKFPDAVLISQLSALVFPAFFVVIPNSFLQSRLANQELYKIAWVSAVIQIVATVIGVLLLGIVGAVLAKLIYRYSLTVYTVYLTKKTDATL